MKIKIFQEEIDEARRLLGYSLLLNKPEAVAKEMSRTGKGIDLDILFEETAKQCEAFLPQGNFFGAPYGGKGMKSLALMNTQSYFQRYWMAHLKQQVIVRAFVYLRNQLSFKDKDRISLYKAVTMSNAFPGNWGMSKRKDYTGLDYFISEKTDGTKLANLNIQTSYRIESALNLAGTYGRSIENIKELLDQAVPCGFDYTPQQISLGKRTTNEIPLAANDMLMLLACHKVPLKHICSGRASNTGDAETVENFILARNELTDYIRDNSNYTRSDKVYLLFKLEEMFDLNMTDCLFQEIRLMRNSGRIVGVSEADVEKYAKCSLLPNYLSRKYYLQMAIDSLLDSKYEKSEDFFYPYEKDAWGFYSDYPKDISTQSNELVMWETRFQRFVKYLSNLAIPVFENYFFILLFDYYSIEGRDAVDVLNHMYEEIVSYINTNPLFEIEQNEMIEPPKNVIDLANDTVEKPLEKGDIDLYLKCIKEIARNGKSKRIRFFLSMEEFDEAFKGHKRLIQRQYILNMR